ncbi:MAG: hypothetical protein IT428_10450 [Planctomycetaceae bacterium]|nr:hypothetical protein [Planctomycetaceae bacterium]
MTSPTGDGASRPAIDLWHFTRDSLCFCLTPLSAWRGRQFTDVVNQWYLRMNAGGSPVPLSFLLDVGNFLLRPQCGLGGTLRHRMTPEIAAILPEYQKMLRRLREQPEFEEVSKLLEEIEEQPELQLETCRQFLKFLLVELERAGTSYPFDRCTLRLTSAETTSRGLKSIRGRCERPGRSPGDPPKREALPATLELTALLSARENEFRPLVELVRWLSKFYLETRLDKILSMEKRLYVHLTARDVAENSVDAHFVSNVLKIEPIPDPVQREFRPELVEKIKPTDTIKTDGPTAGYIDTRIKPFSGNAADIVPAEFGLSGEEMLFYQRLLNEGVQHFVREQIEHIEEETRVLVCFVMDASPSLCDIRGSDHASPFVRARILTAGMLSDLVRYFPREHTRLDVALCLFDGERGASHLHVISPLEAITPGTTDNAYAFAGALAKLAPQLFLHSAALTGLKADDELEEATDPASFFLERRNAKYHCRHFVLFSAERALPDTLGSLPCDGVTASASDMCLVASLDPSLETLKVSFPGRLEELLESVVEGQRMGTVGLRSLFLDHVLARAAREAPGSRTLEIAEA